MEYWAGEPCCGKSLRFPYRAPNHLIRYHFKGHHLIMGTERTRELRRRRHRKKQVVKLVKRAEKGSSADKAIVADKLRKLTSGAEVIIAEHKIESK